MSATKADKGKPPVVRGFMHYFPRAIKAVALASQAGLEKYSLEYEDKNFMGLEPGRLHDADGRHILDEAIDGPYDPETGIHHAALHAWEAMARLEILLESGVAAIESESIRSAAESGLVSSNPPVAEKGVGAAPCPQFKHHSIDTSKPYDHKRSRGLLRENCERCGETLGRHHGWLCPSVVSKA